MEKEIGVKSQKIWTEFIASLDEMSLKDSELFKQYSILKNAEKVISDRVKELSLIILEEMKRTGEKKKIFDYGGFTLVPQTSWSYSKEVTSIEDKLKLLKYKEKEEGIATKEMSETIRFS